MAQAHGFFNNEIQQLQQGPASGFQAPQAIPAAASERVARLAREPAQPPRGKMYNDIRCRVRQALFIFQDRAKILFQDAHKEQLITLRSLLSLDPDGVITSHAEQLKFLVAAVWAERYVIALAGFDAVNLNLENPGQNELQRAIEVVGHMATHLAEQGKNIDIKDINQRLCRHRQMLIGIIAQIFQSAAEEVEAPFQIPQAQP